jgi:2',3'-cyclic-nucleotide 2'-phosphodiesterase (5'-nucleotidase family)
VACAATSTRARSPRACSFEAILGRLGERGDHASGVSYTRVDRDAENFRVGGKKVEASQTYRLCTNDYVFEGGGRYPFEDVSAVNYTGVLLRDLLIETFEKAAAEGRAIEAKNDDRVKGG